MPLYGKIADIHGRRFALLYRDRGLHGRLAGLRAGAVDDDPDLSAAPLQGLGGSGLSSVAIIVLGDAVAPKDRGRYYAYFSITYTTAGAIGPALGGFIAEHLHWSVIFWLNIPLGVGGALDHRRRSCAGCRGTSGRTAST